MLKLDLNDLTDEKIAEARPHMGKCRYATPCIIGTLIPPEERLFFDNFDDTSIDHLVRAGRVQFPPGQMPLAVKLQLAFDDPEYGEFDKTLAEVRAKLGRPGVEL